MPTVTVNGISAQVSETGEGEPVVLLHSGAGEARDWRRFTAALPAGYRCAALDFYGCGGTPAWPGPAALTMDDQAHLVATLARSIGAPVHLCGHSYGGAVALRLAVTQPELVRTLSLIEPQCYPLLREISDPLFEVSESLWHSFCAALERGEPEHGWRQFIDYYSGDGFFDRLRPEMRASFVAVSPIERWAVLFSNPTTIDDARRVQVPTLVLCGENTTPPERRMCEIIASAVPRATLGVLPGAGHMSPITHPKEVAGTLARYISTHLGAS
ncbi:MAG TPA: alpha/beta hydrolase [Kofleriaceae bacterium]